MDSRVDITMPFQVMQASELLVLGQWSSQVIVVFLFFIFFFWIIRHATLLMDYHLGSR